MPITDLQAGLKLRAQFYMWLQCAQTKTTSGLVSAGRNTQDLVGSVIHPIIVWNGVFSSLRSTRLRSNHWFQAFVFTENLMVFSGLDI